MKNFKNVLYYLLIVTLLGGCKAVGNLHDVSSSNVPYTKEPSKEYVNGSDILLIVEGDKTFSGRPSTSLGKIFFLNLDLELIQKESAKKVIGNQLTESSGVSSNIKMTSSISNFSWRLRNVGLIGQVASVSFELDIAVSNDKKTLFETRIPIVDYHPEEAEYKAYEDLFIGPLLTAHITKADKLALSAFIASSKIISEKYDVILGSIE